MEKACAQYQGDVEATSLWVCRDPSVALAAAGVCVRDRVTISKQARALCKAGVATDPEEDRAKLALAWHSVRSSNGAARLADQIADAAMVGVALGVRPIR